MRNIIPPVFATLAFATAATAAGATCQPGLICPSPPPPPPCAGCAHHERDATPHAAVPKGPYTFDAGGKCHAANGELVAPSHCAKLK
jgi:hypothetical protein